MSDNRMTTEVRVNTSADASAIDKLLSKIRELDATLRKLGKSPVATGINADIARTDALAGKVGATFARNESAAMTALNRRFAFERRMTRQKAGEEAETARQSRMFDSEALTRLKERMAFQGRMARQQQEEARETARIQEAAARASARAARDAAREQAQVLKSQIAGFRELERERNRTMKAAASSVGKVGGAVRRGAVAGAAGAAIVGAGARREFDKLTQSGVSIDEAMTQAQIHIFGTMPAGEARKAADGLRKRLMNVAVKYGSKTSDLIAGFVEASQAGVDSDILDKVVGDGARYAKMNKLNLSSTLEETGYALQGLKAFGQVTDKTVGQYFNHMSYLVATTAANREQMSSFTKRGLAAGASVGMSMDDTLAFGAAATASGAQGSQAARMLSSQGGRIAGWEMRSRDIARKGHKSEEDRQFLEVPRLLSFQNFGQLAAAFKKDFFGTFATVQEQLRRIKDPLKRRSVEKQILGQEFGSLTDSMVMGSNLRDYRNKLKSSEADTFLDRNWSKQAGSFQFIVDQVKSVFGNLSDNLGLELKPLWADLRDWTLRTPEAFDGFSETFRLSLRGFMTGLGSTDGTMAGLLRHWFGDPSGFRLNSAAWGDFFRGVGRGLRDVGETIKAFFRVFTGSDSPETIGRWTARIVGFSAALVALSPLLSVFGALTGGILAIASALKVGKSVLDLAKGKPPVTPEGPAAAAESGVLARALGFLGRMIPAIAMPLTSDASKADNDRLMRRLGEWAKGQRKDERPTWQDPPARVQRQSANEDWRSYVHPASLETEDMTTSVEKLTGSVDRLGARIQLAALDGSGALSAQRIARAAGTGTVGTVMSSVGIPYTPGAGGAALANSTPGGKLPDLGGTGVRGSGGFGGDNASPDQKAGGSRSWRNNNPGNIEFGAFAKANGAIGSDGRFAKFPSYEAGRKAQEKLLFDSKGYRDLTLSQAIRRWAPASENNVPAYLAAMHADPNARMSSFNPDQRGKLLDAMQAHEGWKPGTVAGRTGAVADAGGGNVLGRMQDLQANGRVVNEQCVSLAKAAVGVNDSVTTWRKGVAAEAGTLKPGTPIATFLDRYGKQSERYAGGGTGTMGAHRDHAGVFESYIRDKGGKIIGMNVAEQFKGSRGVHSHPYMFGQGSGEGDAANYHAIKDAAGRYLGGDMNPMNRDEKGLADRAPTDPAALARQSPAERLAREAPPPSHGGGAGRSGPSIAPTIHVHQAGNPEHTANEVSKRLQDLSTYSTTDMLTRA